MSNMTELLPVVIISMILAVISHMRSDYSYTMERYRRKEKLCYVVMAVIMVLFVGLRTKCNDTGAYRHAYELMSADGSIFDAVDDWSIGSNPGFNLVNSILKRLGASTQTFLMFYAIVTVSIYLWFLRKYSTNLWLTLFLCITTGVYTFTLAAIKQCVAMAICLLATDCALRKKWVPFVLWVALATLFHPYSFMYLPVPLLTFCPWTRWTYLTLLVFALAGVLLQSLLGSIINITTMMGEEYSAESFSGEGVNPFRLAVCAVPLLISFIAQKHIAFMDKEKEKPYYLFLNLSILNAEIMFVALFGTANYFARLANYFLIFQTLSIPWLLQFFDKKSRQLLTVAAVVCYCLYFYYANAINQPFNAEYDSVTIWEYLRSLF